MGTQTKNFSTSEELKAFISTSTSTMGKADTKSTKPEEKTPVKTVATKNAPPKVSFEIKPLHQQALLVLFRCNHNGQTLTYAELSAEVGKGEKTKAWQCEAWKDLKSNGLIVPAAEAKHFQLSSQGIELAKSFVSEEELAEYMTPTTNEEYHEKIRNRLLRNENKGKLYGPKIFNLMLELSLSDTKVTRGQLASKLSTNPDAHGFFYGFKNLQKMGMIEEAGSLSKSEMNKQKIKNEEDDDAAETDGGNDNNESDKNIKQEEGDHAAEDTEKKGDEEAENKKKKKKKSKCTRNRGGYKLFKLSSKAFLATASN